VILLIFPKAPKSPNSPNSPNALTIMSGHSKWSSIKHKKAAIDSKRGKVFTKMAKIITVAAQQGGGDVDMNSSLRMAVQKAKSVGVPAANIDRAIKKGTGELKGDRLEEVIYEGYGPEGVAILIRCLTDNTNRSYTNMRTIMTKNGGNLGSTGCVSYLFARKGAIEADKVKVDHEELELGLIDAGAEDISWEDDFVYVETAPETFEQCLKVFDNIPVQKSDITLVATKKKEVDGLTAAQKIVKLIELIEDDDDVDEVFTNADFPAKVLEEL